MTAWIIAAGLVFHSTTYAQKLMEVVRVRLDKDQSILKITGKNIQVVGQYQLDGMSSIEVRRALRQGKPCWRINTKIEICEKFLQIVGTDMHRGANFLPPLLTLSGSRLKFDLIGELPLENYVIGVLASEMPLTWPTEALKAQAVAARSYTVAVAAERRRLHFDVESTIQDQVFRHVSPALDEDPLIMKAKKAVESTTGLIVYAPAGGVLKTYYHSDCGGKTKSPKNVWGYGVNTGTATDSFCPTNPMAKWVHRESVEKLSKKINAQAGLLDRIELVQQAKTGIQIIKLFWQNHQIGEILGNSFRELIGYSDLRSLNFKVIKKNTETGAEFEFQGTGFGHGVGMCQWGSRVMAQKGLHYDAILQHYYPLAAIGRKAVPEKSLPISASQNAKSEESNARKYQ